MLNVIEFFAGSGLVTTGLKADFEAVWANDNSAKKMSVYSANHGLSAFQLDDIREVHGAKLPRAALAWASFPCQDLSLAGNMLGMEAGTRSGLFWEWIRILWQLREVGRLPPVLVAENVVGFLVADGGQQFATAYKALRELGYLAGSLVVDARLFTPQSRPRAFLVAVRDGISLEGLAQPGSSMPFHTPAVLSSALAASDSKWIWWSLPRPTEARLNFADICDWEAVCDTPEKTEHLCAMLSLRHKQKIESLLASRMRFAVTAYRRTRPDAEGATAQKLEVRFDGLAGCLRTPNGGSSRQIVLLSDGERLRSRLLTVRECARLMGAPDSFILPGTYNDGYHAMGDGVAVPVSRWLSTHLLRPLAERAIGLDSATSVRSLYHSPIFPVHLPGEAYIDG